MAINAIQAAIRSMTGTERQFTGDFHAYWDQLGIPPGQFAERMVAWKQLPQNAAWIAATEDADAPEVVDGLWKNGEQGVWYDSSDLSTMFQDAAGTLPVYMPGGGQVDPPVGRILDKSGRGNHATQATTTSRPTLSARYNLLTASEDLKASVWQKSNSTAPTPSRLVETTAASTHYVSQPYSAASGTPVRFSVRARPEGRNWIRLTLSLASGGDASSYFDLSAGSKGSLGGGSATITPVGDGSYICTVQGTITSSNPSCGVLLASDNNAQNYTGDGTSGVDVLWSDLRVANDGVGLPPYQRVVDANTYDTAGFPLYLRFDGVDDFLQTANIDFSAASSITAFAAVRKLSDATRGIIFELGSLGYGQPGSFNFEQAWFSPNFSASHSGASGNATTTKAGIGAPASAVLSAVFDQSAPVARLRYQGQDASQNAGVVGGGGYLNAPIYIGRRAGTSSPASMRLYGAAIRAGVLGGVQISAVERYLNQKAKVF